MIELYQKDALPGAHVHEWNAPAQQQQRHSSHQKELPERVLLVGMGVGLQETMFQKWHASQHQQMRDSGGSVHKVQLHNPRWVHKMFLNRT